MVYPAVNAFTACEPGILTKPLSKMNNFVSYDSGNNTIPSPDSGAHRRSHETTRVTPETIKTRASVMHSPQSSLSTHSPDDSLGHEESRHLNMVEGHPPRAIRKRSHVHVSRGDDTILRAAIPPGGTAPFVASLTLRPEHYRAVTRKSKGDQQQEQHQEDNAYQYDHVPLTFTERKRLSDTLFFLSKEIPTLTRDVAGLLREAREKDEWDLAVAEVMAQVVVGLHCGEGDHRLDGLQQYLLGIGISC
jgi:hypothetical protein